MSKKHQVPVLGGLRKVIRTGDDAPPGTTIAEIGDQTVTLAQLAALIGAIQAQNKNPGTPVASIALGPGLTGGGPVIGIVPIRLDTLPAVIFDVDSDSGGGTDGFMIPGPAGARGLPGQAVFYIPEDGEEGMMGAPAPITPGPRGLSGPPGFDGADGDDPLFIPGPIGPQGPQGIPGTGGTGSSAGPPGQDGADGEDAMMIPGNPGPQGTPGAQGLTGASMPGSSGDDGDDAPWIPGQIGPRGAGGAQGAPGQDGADGEDAMMIPGNPGPTGATGTPGTPGTPGATGASVPGFSGEDGEDGLWIPGQIGLRGVQGIQGATGLEGDAGEDAMMIPGLPGPLAANPTASLGLVTINGTAVTFMRSDAAPALDVSIAPVWTGVHTFQSVNTTPVIFGGISYTGGVTVQLTNTSTVNGDISRYSIIAGSTNLAIYAANQNQAAAIVTNGPTGPQAVLRTLGAQPIVFGIGNTYAGQLDASGNWVTPTSVLAPNITRVITGLVGLKPTTTTSIVATVATEGSMLLTVNEIGWYDVDAYLSFFEATAGTGGFKFDFGAGTATVANPNFAVNGFSTAAFSNAAVTSLTTATGIATIGTASGTPSWVKVKGIIQVTVVGTFGLRWSQNTLLAVDPTSLLLGSHLILTKIG